MTDRVDLDDWIARIRSHDPMTFEDAYFEVRPVGPDVVSRLIAELQKSTDGYTRGKFCELLGEIGDESVIPILEQELAHSDEKVRGWAASALVELQSNEVREAKKVHLRMFASTKVND